MEKIVWETPEEINYNLALRLRKIRERRGISKKELSKISCVSYKTIKRFENTGQISLLMLTKIATALNLSDEINCLFTQVPYNNIEEVIRETKNMPQG